MAISPLPTPPTTADPANFNSRADAFVGALTTFQVEANATGAQATADAAASAASASNAASSASNAASSASSAAGSANQAAAVGAFKGAWSTLTGALARPASTLHQGAYWLLLNDLSNVAASQPGVSADWAVFSPAFPIVAISTNTSASNFTHYLITAACQLTLPSAPQIGTQIRFTNVSGLSTPTINPGAEKIRGVSGVMALNVPTAAATISYSGSTYGWI